MQARGDLRALIRHRFRLTLRDKRVGQLGNQRHHKHPDTKHRHQHGDDHTGDPGALPKECHGEHPAHDQ